MASTFLAAALSAASVAWSQAAVVAPDRSAAAAASRTPGSGKAGPDPRLEHPGPRDVAGAPFIVIYKSDGGDNPDGVDISLDLLVSPSDRRITGVFEMMRPLNVRSNVGGEYTQASASPLHVASFTGYPGGMLPCFGHGLQVSSNSKITLRIAPDWRSATADISYPTDSPEYLAQPHLAWRDVSGIELLGSRPLHWKGVADILLGPVGPLAWNGKCFDSRGHLASRYRLIGADAAKGSADGPDHAKHQDPAPRR